VLFQSLPAEGLLSEFGCFGYTSVLRLAGDLSMTIRLESAFKAQEVSMSKSSWSVLSLVFAGLQFV
jgi:hypothetical protein